MFSTEKLRRPHPHVCPRMPTAQADHCEGKDVKVNAVATFLIPEIRLTCENHLAERLDVPRLSSASVRVALSCYYDSKFSL